MSWLREFWPWLLGAFTVCTVLFILYTLFFSNRPTVRQYTYKETPQGKLTLEIHLPRNWSEDDRRPAVLFFFGGGWISGGIEHFSWQADYLARRGVVAVRVDYRVDSRHHTTPDKAVEDGFDALLWLQRHAAELGINPQQIVSSGASAGGHIAACLAMCNHPADIDMTSMRPALLVLFNPVLNLVNPTAEEEFTSREIELIAMMPESAVAALSPNLHIDGSTPPTLLMFGDRDGLLAQGNFFAEKALSEGVPATLLTAQGQAHGFFNREPWRSATTLAMDHFLLEQGYLSGAPLIDEALIEKAMMKKAVMEK